MFSVKKISDIYQNRYHFLLDNVLDIICELDLNGFFVYINSYIYEILGYKSKEIIGKNLIEFIHPENQQKFEQLIKDSIKNCKFIFHKFRILHKRGYFIDCFLRGRVVNMEDGPKVIAIIKDITESTKTEQKLKELEEKYRNLVETSSMALMEIDVKNGGIVYINPKLLEIIGYTQEDIINSGLFYKAIYSKDYDKFINFNNKKNIQFRILDKEGNIKWLSGRVLHQIDDKGEIILSRLWLQDITEMKELEEIKSNLLIRISHEIKTPLISINGFTELLLTRYKINFNKQVISFLERIKEGGEKLKLLVNRFLETSQLDESLINLKFSHENLSTLIKKGVDEMEGLIKLRNQIITADIADKLYICIDKEKIQFVLSNLLINAIKYTPKEGKIDIKSKIKKKTVIISVRDNGIGLEKQEIKNLFKPFGKIEKYGRGWDIISDGIGLGLYLSKEIINLHNGEIWAESLGLNRGSTFYFSLPLIKSNKYL